MGWLNDSLRSWRRAFKAALPYVRRREYRALQRIHAELIEAVDGQATPAVQARLQVIKPMAAGLAGELCLFVTFADRPHLKPHVVTHLEHLLAAGIHVVLIVNTDLAADDLRIDPRLQARLDGALVRQNIGFDFGAWAHAWSLGEGAGSWSRLYLVNDSIVGPLNGARFARLLERVRSADADVIGLTESLLPRRHLQSYFLVLNGRALRSEALRGLMRRVLNWPTKSQVIEVYETRVTALLEAQGLRCVALFPSLWNDPRSSDDTSARWGELVDAGFPYLKARVIAGHPNDERIRAWLAAAQLNDRAPS
jgi:lipopolysaccharide biosynthesis protein